MTDQEEKERLRLSYRDLCLAFVACLRALSLYLPEHPETEKKIETFLQRLSSFLSQRPTLTILFVGGDVALENVRLPELSSILGKLVQRFEQAHIQRLLFRQGLTQEEIILFLQVLLPLLKNPTGADLVLAKNQVKFPHILASRIPFDTSAKISYEEFSGVIQAARQSILSCSYQLKDLFSHMEGPIPEEKVSAAKDAIKTIQTMIAAKEMPLKILIYRRSTDPDPYLHAINVCALSMALAEQMRVERTLIRDIGLAGLLHDIGLHLAPHRSLSKTAAITLDERKKHWEHPIRGAEALLASRGIPDLVPIVVYEHHLHYNGGGYPEQKVTRELNLASMMVSVTDSYDNLRRNRPDQEALSLAEALNWMDSRQNEEFHPLLLKKFRAMVKAQAEEKI